MSVARSKTGNIVLHLPANENGTDYFVSDIHGNVSRLKTFMERIDFKYNHDRLFIVGDTVDRGTEGYEVFDMVDFESIFAVRGNHDDMIITSFSTQLEPGSDLHQSQEYYATRYRTQYGAWTYKHSDAELKMMADTMIEWPFVIIIDDEMPTILVHAQLPDNITKYQLYDHEYMNNLDSNALLVMIWSRDVANKRTSNVSIIADIICGHTPHKEMVQIGQYKLIDTTGGKPTRQFTAIDTGGNVYRF